MVKVKPFAAIRPPKEIVKEVASRPYDVLNSKEAKAEAGEKSLLHIIKPEIDFDPIADEHSQPVYDKAVENFKLWQQSACAKDKSKRFLRLNALNNLSVYREGVLQCNNFILIDCHIIILLYYVNDCFLLHSSLFSYLILLPNLYIL